MAQKTRRACEVGDALAASYAAYLLQHEVSSLLNKVQPGFEATEFNLLCEYGGAYAAAGFPDLVEAAAHAELDALAQRAQALEGQLVAWLIAQGISLNIVAGSDALRAFLLSRAA